MTIGRVAIVGGGTAGWLAALILQDAARRAEKPLELTVIESSKIPTIGVGEGTTSVFRGLLLHLGIEEFDFLRSTDATIKYGIRHRDWRAIGHSYDGPIDDPHQVSQTPPGTTSSWLNQYCLAAGRSVTEPHLFTYLMERGRAPFITKGRETPLPIGPFHHAFHFDQAEVGKFLKRWAKGIPIIDAVVTDAERDTESGHITRLTLDDGQTVEADFVVDCTGFRRALIGKVMEAGWVSYSDDLPVNRAMPFWLEHPEEGEIPPVTLAWAQTSGWMWQIPTQSRMGCGYVYSDKFLTPDEAKAEIEGVLGHAIEPRNDIKIEAGRLDKAWIGNCAAAGLAQSFFEPLEATSIHGTIVQMLLLSQALISEQPEKARDAYNAAVARQGDDFRTFINTHYVSQRTDSPFWRHVAEACIHPDAKVRLETWREHTPRRGDFEQFPGGLPHIEEQLYYPVLDGLGLLDQAIARRELAETPALRAHARKTCEALTKEYRRAAGKAPSHRQFLAGLHEGGQS
ncbi:MAG: tryptophan halogenase family protein [Pseudomonadota bacterium]